MTTRIISGDDSKRCRKEVYDGWEDTDRCLSDSGHSGNHNFLNPETPMERRRFNHDCGKVAERDGGK